MLPASGRPTLQLHNLAFHGHAYHPQAPMRDVWSARKRRGTEETHGSYSLTASKIQFDVEGETSRESEDLSMTEIEYIPTQGHGSSGNRR
jgi:hypothetical protein